MLEIKIPMPALSLNHSHMSLKRGGRIKKNETRVYEKEFCVHLLKYQQQIKEFLQLFNPEVMGIEAHYLFYFNRDDYYTKKGRLSRKLPDTDNLIKIPQDLIFGQIVDDTFIVTLQASKLPTTEPAYILVRLHIVSVPTL
jgi:Holliday junction resolvase RusA-like endonuclease